MKHYLLEAFKEADKPVLVQYLITTTTKKAIGYPAPHKYLFRSGAKAYKNAAFTLGVY